MSSAGPCWRANCRSGEFQFKCGPSVRSFAGSDIAGGATGLAWRNSSGNTASSKRQLSGTARCGRSWRLALSFGTASGTHRSKSAPGPATALLKELRKQGGSDRLSGGAPYLLVGAPSGDHFHQRSKRGIWRGPDCPAYPARTGAGPDLRSARDALRNGDLAQDLCRPKGARAGARRPGPARQCRYKQSFSSPICAASRPYRTRCRGSRSSTCWTPSSTSL